MPLQAVSRSVDVHYAGSSTLHAMLVYALASSDFSPEPGAIIVGKSVALSAEELFYLFHVDSMVVFE